VIIGALTFLKLAKIKSGKKYSDYIEEIVTVYIDIISELIKAGAEWIQIDEPILVTDLSLEDIDSFKKIYKLILSNKGKVKILLQTYFGDVRDVYSEITKLDFDGVGLILLKELKILS
jgi:5-methyltetrahydropteroyltriglutamate--homocysteine methyltransferase